MDPAAIPRSRPRRFTALACGRVPLTCGRDNKRPSATGIDTHVPQSAVRRVRADRGGRTICNVEPDCRVHTRQPRRLRRQLLARRQGHGLIPKHHRRHTDVRPIRRRPHGDRSPKAWRAIRLALHPWGFRHLRQRDLSTFLIARELRMGASEPPRLHAIDAVLLAVLAAGLTGLSLSGRLRLKRSFPIRCRTLGQHVPSPRETSGRRRRRGRSLARRSLPLGRRPDCIAQ